MNRAAGGRRIASLEAGYGVFMIRTDWVIGIVYIFRRSEGQGSEQFCVTGILQTWMKGKARLFGGEHDTIWISV